MCLQCRCATAAPVPIAASCPVQSGSLWLACLQAAAGCEHIRSMHGRRWEAAGWVCCTGLPEDGAALADIDLIVHIPAGARAAQAQAAWRKGSSGSLRCILLSRLPPAPCTHTCPECRCLRRLGAHNAALGGHPYGVSRLLTRHAPGPAANLPSLRAGCQPAEPGTSAEGR